MKIPEFFESLIKKDSAISAGIYASIPKFEMWIENSTLPFFPEYTKHDLEHIEDVLNTARDLIHSEAEDLITPGDSAVLVFSCLLHDSAMHLTEDGFISLIAEDGCWKPIPEFDSISWCDLWENFMSDARRFDGRRLTALFGDSEPISRPNFKKGKFTNRDKLLIGEFIRRNHARLAHEIAVYGLPGVDGSSYLVVLEADQALADIAGLVARSHGLPLRSCLDYLDDKYHLRDFNGIHAVYLMTLLRNADYLQIQSQRAPKELLEIRKLQSPISQGEWKVHECIRNITLAEDDPEAIFIDAEPSDAKTYLRVKNWIQGIQEELDKSWAILGEVFGRFSQEDLNHLGLRLRRIKSNLDHWEEFAQRVDFVPSKIAFEAANPDLLKLLVGPLYEDKPEIGIRELIQNAVDAVRELEEFLKHHPNFKNVKRLTQKEDVRVTIEFEENEPRWVSITDRGIGMNLDVVKSYFLKAGASFRKSDAWKKEFEDDEGHANILRSGRFGVGALAAFLIGDEIEVKTRHIQEPEEKGLYFKAGLDYELINLKWVSIPVGTEIRIKISENKLANIKDLVDSGHNHIDSQYWYIHDKRGEEKWDWFCLKKPLVVRAVLPEKKVFNSTLR